jgi:hypothetical protein
MSEKNNNIRGSETQIRYAEVLHWIALIGLALLLVTFVLYVSGLIPPLVEPSEVPAMWHLSAEEYTEANNIPTGWAWIREIVHGDVLSFASLVLLASGTIICFIITLFSFLKDKDWIYSGIIILEIFVLLLAASGLVAGGH